MFHTTTGPGLQADESGIQHAEIIPLLALVVFGKDEQGFSRFEIGDADFEGLDQLPVLPVYGDRLAVTQRRIFAVLRNTQLYDGELAISRTVSLFPKKSF